MNDSTVTHDGVVDIEKAPSNSVAQTAMSSSSAIEKGDVQSEAISKPQNPPMGAIQEPRIEKWRLVSLYVR
jgi:hypothetical protein